MNARPYVLAALILALVAGLMTAGSRAVDSYRVSMAQARV